MAAAIGLRGTKILRFRDTTLRNRVSVPKGTPTPGVFSSNRAENLVQNEYELVAELSEGKAHIACGRT